MKVKLKIKKIDSEYCVQWIEEGVFIESKSYYTDCKQDATDTEKMNSLKAIYGNMPNLKASGELTITRR